MRLGYGSAAVELLIKYFEGQLTTISGINVLEKFSEPTHLRVTEAAEKNSVTGEHTCMMLKASENDEIEVSGSDEWGFGPYYEAFKTSFARKLSREFLQTMEYNLAMSVLDPKLNYTDTDSSPSTSYAYLVDIIKSPRDMNKLEAYVNHLGDYRSISELLLDLARLYFQGKLSVTLSYNQASVLICVGLQNRLFGNAVELMKLRDSNVLSHLRSVLKKFYRHLTAVASNVTGASLPPVKEVSVIFCYAFYKYEEERH